MNAVIKIFILFVLFTTAQSGPLAIIFCKSACDTAWVGCVSAAGGVAGVTTAGGALPAAVLACNVAHAGCYAVCAAAICAPTP